MDALRRLIRTELDRQQISYRQAAERSQGLISYGHLNQLATGREGGNLSEQVLAGIALAIDVPLAKVRRAYGQPSKGPIEFILPPGSERLSEKERRVIRATIAAFLDAKKDSRPNEP
jgi:hypothetical protein